ncbi:MAG: DUF411 domain-containing protein [Gemmatimonadota bacterium]
MKKVFALLACCGAAAIVVAATASETATAPADAAAEPQQKSAAAPVRIEVYKTATCGCCKLWVDHVRAAGFDVRATDLEQAALDARKASLGVGARLQSCHTSLVNGYVIEGHVPADDIKRLIREKADVAGLAAPGMPVGSPGMEVGGRRDPYDVISFTKAGALKVYAKH